MVMFCIQGVIFHSSKKKKKKKKEEEEKLLTYFWFNGRSEVKIIFVLLNNRYVSLIYLAILLTSFLTSGFNSSWRLVVIRLRGDVFGLVRRIQAKQSKFCNSSKEFTHILF